MKAVFVIGFFAIVPQVWAEGSNCSVEFAETSTQVACVQSFSGGNSLRVLKLPPKEMLLKGLRVPQLPTCSYRRLDQSREEANLELLKDDLIRYARGSEETACFQFSELEESQHHLRKPEKPYWGPCQQGVGDDLGHILNDPERMAQIRKAKSVKLVCPTYFGRQLMASSPRWYDPSDLRSANESRWAQMGLGTAVCQALGLSAEYESEVWPLRVSFDSKSHKTSPPELAVADAHLKLQMVELSDEGVSSSQIKGGYLPYRIYGSITCGHYWGDSNPMRSGSPLVRVFEDLFNPRSGQITFGSAGSIEKAYSQRGLTDRKESPQTGDEISRRPAGALEIQK